MLHLVENRSNNSTIQTETDLVLGQESYTPLGTGDSTAASLAANTVTQDLQYY